MPTWFLGRTGYSFFDVWSLVHFAFWIFAGSCLWAAKLRIGYALAGSVLLALAWECFERVAEKKWPDYWLHPESWWNSWASDVLMCALGVLLIWRLLDAYAK
jgi:hypothetical protein